MNRGARRAELFLDDDCCCAFLGLLADLPQRFGVEVHAYALMPNHFHLLVRCPRAGLGRAMQHLSSRYARWLNARRRWDGPVFRGRYLNRVVEDDAYRAHLLAYLHLNPVAAGLVKSADQGRWTSHRAYLGLDSTPEWLRLDELLAVFGTREALATYVWEVRVGREEGPKNFDSAMLWGKPVTASVPSQRPPPPRYAAWPMTEAEAWGILSRVTGRPRGAMLAATRGRAHANNARDVALWWLPMALGQSQGATARALGLDASTVSRAARRARGLGEEDARVARWMERLRGFLPAE